MSLILAVIHRRHFECISQRILLLASHWQIFLKSLEISFEYTTYLLFFTPPPPPDVFVYSFLSFAGNVQIIPIGDAKTFVNGKLVTETVSLQSGKFFS